jgi:hypothetical protein
MHQQSPIVPRLLFVGAIIPKIEVRDCVPDPTFKDRDEKPNPITIHVYPGKDNVSSESSAEIAIFLHLEQIT